MNDLISRSALLADIEETVVFSVKDGQPSAEIRGANKITDRIKNAPAVDAVEVVRCKNCKHSELEFFADNGTTRTERYKCFHHRMGINVLEHDDFCRYGERRADDGSNH